jgi:hypothetical protein
MRRVTASREERGDAIMSEANVTEALPQTVVSQKRRRLRRNWRRKFLDHLREFGNISWACESAGISRRTYQREMDKDPDFRELVQLANESATDLLEREQRRRALGVERPLVFRGRVQGDWVDANGRPAEAHAPGAKFLPQTVMEYSDRCLIDLIHRRKGLIGTPQQTTIGQMNVQVVNVAPEVQAEHMEALARLFMDKAAQLKREAGPVPPGAVIDTPALPTPSIVPAAVPVAVTDSSPAQDRRNGQVQAAGNISCNDPGRPIKPLDPEPPITPSFDRQFRRVFHPD